MISPPITLSMYAVRAKTVSLFLYLGESFLITLNWAFVPTIQERANGDRRLKMGLPSLSRLRLPFASRT